MHYCLKVCHLISIYIGTELNVTVYTDIKILTDICLHRTHFYTKCLVELCECPTHCTQVTVSTLRTYFCEEDFIFWDVMLY